ncbi:MAG: AIR synthase family protein [Anaerolineae bacterium]|nr:AIR synthase family protein [Anaerolineae bacterium]
MGKALPLGKLTPQQLGALLERHTFSLPDDRVLVYPGVGEDAAVIDVGPSWLVVKTDPITFATDEIGWYAVQINANDVAAAGGIPRWFLSTILLPGGQADETLVDAIMAQIGSACRALRVVPCGGHTEVTYGLDRPIVVGVMLGEVSPGRLIRSGGVEAGDVVLLTKGIAVEGTAIIAREMHETLRSSFPGELLDRCRRFLRDPGISVVREARLATQVAAVHAMHDPTEGGLATGLWELASASQVGLEVDEASIPVFEETQALCAALGLDPLGVIASGALLIAVSPAEAGAVCDALHADGIAATAIARAVPPERGLVLRGRGGTRPLPRFDQDEIARLYE